jgi:hypothetical protein
MQVCRLVPLSDDVGTCSLRRLPQWRGHPGCRSDRH